MTYDPLYIQYLYYFNVDRDYFECHEVMEELWLEEGRSLLYQGLIQIAVALHHYSYGNRSGARKLFVSGISKLERYPQHRLGIDLEKMIKDAKEYLEGIEDEHNPVDFYHLNIVITDPDLEESVEELRRHPPDKHDSDDG